MLALNILTQLLRYCFTCPIWSIFRLILPGQLCNIMISLIKPQLQPNSDIWLRTVFASRLRSYDTKILPDSYNRPYLLYAYSDFCYQCMRVEMIWDRIVHDMDTIGKYILLFTGKWILVYTEFSIDLPMKWLSLQIYQKCLYYPTANRFYILNYSFANWS